MRQILLYFSAAFLMVVSSFAAETPPVEGAPVADETATVETATAPDADAQVAEEAPAETAGEETAEPAVPMASEELEAADVAAETESPVAEVEEAAVSEEEATTADTETTSTDTPTVASTETEPASLAPESEVPSDSAAEEEAARSDTAKAVDAMMRAETDALISRMSVMEQFLIAQHDREIALYRDTIRLVTTFGVAFAVIACLGLLAAAFLNYRALMTVQGLVAHAQLPPSGPGTSANLLPSGETVPGMERVQASGQRFHSEMSSLDHRLSELESIAAGREHATAVTENPKADESGILIGASDASFEPPPQRVVPRAAILAHKAQALMNLGKLDEALETLDEAGTLGDARSEVFLTRGKVLEKLGRLDSAIEAFDEAAQCDESNTNALLMKAGALNRQERYSEALECYEQALAVHRLAT